LILLTVGTHDQPFERAIDLVGPLVGTDRVVIQHGHTPPRLGLRAEWREFVSREEMEGLMRDASTVICHAGVGCIVTALTLGRMPIVIPRLSARGEHVDDHQLQIATAMHAAGMVAVCDGEQGLDDAIRRTRSQPPRLGGNRELHRAIATATLAA
jgi:UDP-N-acetylglucosamine transferase subunit ALG13